MRSSAVTGLLLRPALRSSLSEPSSSRTPSSGSRTDPSPAAAPPAVSSAPSRPPYPSRRSITIAAIIGGAEGIDDVAIGAIVGPQPVGPELEARVRLIEP